MRKILSSKWGKIEVCAVLFGLIGFFGVFLALTLTNTNSLKYTAQAQTATVSTDATDYAAGDMAEIFGSGWEPGESVALEIVGDPSMDPDAPPDTLYAVADTGGNISNQYMIPGHGVDQTFTLTATGMNSSSSAQTTFTNNLNSASPPAPESESSALATVMTDKPDYVPGEVVQITGSGWEPGETVELYFVEEPLIHDPETLYAIADENGNIYAEYVIQEHDVGQTFTLTATGMTSGLTAQTTFTDGSTITSVTLNGGPSVTVLPGATISAVVNVTTNLPTSGADTWGSTAWRISTTPPGSFTCVNHGDHGSPGVTGMFTETFNITAPATAGTYNAYFFTGSNDTCAGNLSAPFTVTNGVIVTLCGNGTVNAGEQCDLGTNNGQPGFCCAANCTFVTAASNTVCRAGSGDTCDPNETCSGASGTCPADTIAAATTVCNPGSGDICDPDESCTGVADAACPADNIRPATTVCNPGSGDLCDPDESCTGVADAACPADVIAPATTTCRVAVSECDADESCTGVAEETCPDDQFASCLTNSSLCLFDVNPSTDACEFRLLFTPDQNYPSAYKQNASNPGQYYYNVFYYGNGGVTIDIVIPYPFVTQGARPIHIYDDVPSLDMCIVPGTEIANSDTTFTMDDYTDTNGDGMVGYGDTFTVPVEIPDVTGTGFAYINIHLDWGLKGTTGYVKGGVPGCSGSANDAVDAGNISAVLIPDCQGYSFSDSTGGSDMCNNMNVFKKNPGIGGLVLQSDGDPVLNDTVKIYDSKNKLLATVNSDEDGWYMWNYKYTGKPATFTVKLPSNNLSQTLTLKSNGFLVVNFTTP